VQTEVGLAIERAASLARVIPDEHLQPYLDQSLATFRDALLNAQIPAQDADQLSTAMSKQIATTVIEPLRHLNQVRDRLDSLERESADSSAKIAELQERVEDLSKAGQAFGSKLWFALGTVSALSLLAALLAVVALVR
jgi:chromosome segregation ATPase